MDKLIRMISYTVIIFILTVLFLTACANGKKAAPSSASSGMAEPETSAAAPVESTVFHLQSPGGEKESRATKDLGNQNQNQDYNTITSPPELSLADALSSTVNQFPVHSGNYSWTYMEHQKPISLVACGLHPLQTDVETIEKLHLPSYNGTDYVPYSVSCKVPPNRLTVQEWPVSELGREESAKASLTTYEEALIINLKPNMVYEIIAEWDEKNLVANGFWGEASYVVITE